MSRFSRSELREVPALNTAALPDLIFTVLFFFMIVTHMRTAPVTTLLDVPEVAELQKLNEKNLIVYLTIGKEKQIQLNSSIVSLKEIPARLQDLKKNIPAEDQGKMLAVLNIDKDIPMGLVDDVKQILRESQILTLHYSAKKIPKHLP
ncbi:MAG: biopolymer transporter ExbD [Candidatus Azobacteroides sp.]|nr:biopolymer transporter ExbD [Candidatus Azobacteroides sp.]